VIRTVTEVNHSHVTDGSNSTHNVAAMMADLNMYLKNGFHLRTFKIKKNNFTICFMRDLSLNKPHIADHVYFFDLLT